MSERVGAQANLESMNDFCLLFRSTIAQMNLEPRGSCKFETRCWLELELEFEPADQLSGFVAKGLSGPAGRLNSGPARRVA